MSDGGWMPEERNLAVRASRASRAMADRIADEAGDLCCCLGLLELGPCRSTI
jgi:hypothetical protein